MLFTMVPVRQEQPLTFGADYLAIDTPEAQAWKKGLQQIHPRLVPQLKENALISEEDSEFCVTGGIFEYVRGMELVIDGKQYILSHCAEHFLDFLMAPEECLEVVSEQHQAFANLNVTDEQKARFATLCTWWEQGWRVLFLQHM